MLFANVVVGLVQLVIAIIFAVVALYIGFAVLSKITKGIDEENRMQTLAGSFEQGKKVAAISAAVNQYLQQKKV